MDANWLPSLDIETNNDNNNKNDHLYIESIETQEHIINFDGTPNPPSKGHVNSEWKLLVITIKTTPITTDSKSESKRLMYRYNSVASVNLTTQTGTVQNNLKLMRTHRSLALAVKGLADKHGPNGKPNYTVGVRSTIPPLLLITTDTWQQLMQHIQSDLNIITYHARQYRFYFIIICEFL